MPASVAQRAGDKRPGLDAMLKAVNAEEFDMVASWVAGLTPPRRRGLIWD